MDTRRIQLNNISNANASLITAIEALKHNCEQKKLLHSQTLNGNTIADLDLLIERITQLLKQLHQTEPNVSSQRLIQNQNMQAMIFTEITDVVSISQEKKLNINIDKYLENHFLMPDKILCNEIENLRRQHNWQMISAYKNRVQRFVMDANQIGHYSSTAEEEKKEKQRLDTILAGTTTDPLYEGIDHYKNKTHVDHVNEYRKKLNHPPLSSQNIPADYLRREFVALLKKIQLDPHYMKYEGDLKEREDNPEKATRTLLKFLGKEGAELYGLALEEERYSREFINEVLNKSTTEYRGEQWAERPLVIVGGPSGCGKSYAADEAVKAAEPFIRKVEGSHANSSNYVIAVDGGIIRERSQMRKLVIKVANDKGFSGITDLHDQSSVLEKVKNTIQNYALQENLSYGVVIPETFSQFPLGPGGKIIDNVVNSPNSKPIFVRVVGKDPGTFQEVVAFMGLRRAWKTLWKLATDSDLNTPTDSENKIYQGQYFKLGEIGSLLAEESIKKSAGKNALVLRVLNDLILIKESPPNSNMWVKASSTDGNAIKISERMFQNWEKIKENERPHLLDYMADKKNRLPAAIHLSSVMGLEKEEFAIRKYIMELHEKLNEIKVSGRASVSSDKEESSLAKKYEHVLNNSN